jgi:hypothetical protein
MAVMAFEYSYGLTGDDLLAVVLWLVACLLLFNVMAKDG